MKQSQFEKALTAAEKELKDLIEQRKVLNTRIEQLRVTIVNLSALCGREVEESIWDETVSERLGLKLLCLRVLEEAKDAVTPLEMKRALMTIGVNPGNYSNFMASVHATLKRLVASGDAVEVVLRKGGKAYQLVEDE
jgi:hypothetical protein